MADTAIRCAAPILGTTLRFTLLNSCGALVTGTGSAQSVIDGFIQVQRAPQYDTGDRKILRLANGQLCHNKKLPDVFTNDQLTIDLCTWDPGLVYLTLGARLLTATESPTGTGTMYGELSTYQHVSVELWQQLDGVGACDAAGNQRYMYHAWPNVADWKYGQSNFNSDPTQMQLMANSFAAFAGWDLGATYLGANQIQAGDHYGWNITTTAPPTAVCLLQDYP